MRRAAVVMLLCLGLLIAFGEGPAREGAAASPPPQTREPSPAAAIAPVAAMPADALVDSFGVGIHLAFLDTPYRDASAVADAVEDLGVRHVRDDLYMNNPRQYAGMRAVAAAGARFDLIMGRYTSPESAADYVDTVAHEFPTGVVESLEGPNEYDISGRLDWVSELGTRQRELYTAAKANPVTADLPVLAPALAFRWNYSTAGDLSPYADEANGHMYPGGYPPSNEISRITTAIRGSIPHKPLVVTEAGYHNAMNTTNGHLPVPEHVGAVYQPRLLLEHVLRGHKRVYSYELIDEFVDPGLTDPEAHFGLLRRDLTPKPSYTAMKNLLGLVADPGPTFTPEPLAFKVTGAGSDARYLLTQKRDGQHVLLLWRDVSVYDPVTQESLAVTPTPVTLHVAETADLSVYRPTQAAAPVAQAQGTQLPLALDGSVTAVRIGPPAPPSSPTFVNAVAGNKSATVTWNADDEPGLTGFEVVRRPGKVTATTGPEQRSFEATGLVNGERYRFSVRAVSPSGSSPAVEAPPVVPARVPSRPRIRSVTTGKHWVKLVWKRSRGRGAPVTGYRVQSDDASRTVSASARKTRITGLPNDTTVRVGIRAENAVGWSQVAWSAYVTNKK